jgi:hypothetical protein
VEIDIQLLPPGDTLELFEVTKLRYNFNSGGRRLNQGTFKIGARQYEMQDATGELELNPADFEPGYHTLNVALNFSSGTGSIADQAGVEGYFKEIEWVMVSDYRAAPNPSIRYYRNEDGFLTITWDSCIQFNFKHYELYRGGSESYFSSSIITNRGQTTFTDSCFFGENTYFVVHTKVKGHQIYETSSCNVEMPRPQINFDSVGPDSILIWWNKGEYAARYSLRQIDLNPVITWLYLSSDTSIIITSPNFGSSPKFELTIQPASGISCGKSAHSKNYTNYYRGQYWIAKNRPNYAYNYADKVIYTNNANYINVHDIESLEIINTAQINQLNWGTMFSSPLNSTQLAATSSQYIYVFENKHLQNPVIIDLGGESSRDYLFLTQNNEVATVVGNEFRLYNVDNQKLITSFEIAEMPYYSRWAGIGVSADANFTGIATHNGVWLYQRVNNQYEQIYHDKQSYRAILFDPVNPERVYISRRDEPDLTSYILPGFIKEQSWELPNPCVICNIDPHSGYMLLNDVRRRKGSHFQP